MEFSKQELAGMATLASCSLLAAGYIGYKLHERKVTHNVMTQLRRQSSIQANKSSSPKKKSSIIPGEEAKDEKFKNIYTKQGVSKSYYTTEGADPVDQYILKHSLREPAVLKELHEYTLANVATPEMLTDPVEAQLFRMLLNMLDAKKCLEVGMYTGYNTLSCALTIPPDGIIYSLEVDKKVADVGEIYIKKAKVDDRVKIIIGDAVKSMDQLIEEKHGGTFDFIYVDADKLSYDKYFEKGLELLRIGGILALDNTLYQGLVVNFDPEAREISLQRAKAIHELNMKLKDDDRFQLSMLKISDGVTLCRKIK